MFKLKHTCIYFCNNYASNSVLHHTRRDNATPSASKNSEVDMIETGWEFESDHEELFCVRRNEMLLNVHRLRNQLWDNASDGAFARVTRRFFRMQLSLMRVSRVFHFLPETHLTFVIYTFIIACV